MARRAGGRRCTGSRNSPCSPLPPNTGGCPVVANRLHMSTKKRLSAANGQLLEHCDFEVVRSSASLRKGESFRLSATAALPERVSKGALPLWPPEAILLLDNFKKNVLEEKKRTTAKNVKNDDGNEDCLTESGYSPGMAVYARMGFRQAEMSLQAAPLL